MTNTVSGLAASVRGATESETFDLAGQNTSTITSNITNGFEKPLPLDKMIRITFVTGAGKLARQKYDEGAAKAVTSALRNLGFEEDRAASAVIECAGTFKLQHDTGKNLKTVVVFPKVTGGNEQASGDDGTCEAAGEDEGSLLPKSSPEHMITFSSTNIFERMLASKCETWSQKKECVAAIGSVKEILKGLDDKLLSGVPLTETEQTFYDAVSMATLDEKQAHVRDQMHKHVDNGQITLREKETLLNQVTEKLENLSKEIPKAHNDGKKKRVENLKAAKQKAEDRKGKLEKINPVSPPKLKHEIEINKLRKEMQPLQEIEEAAKGRLLSIKETQAVAKKDEILEQIQQLEISSRGWFETDRSFEARVKASRSAWELKNKKKKVSKPAGYTPAASKWATPTTRKKATTSAWGSSKSGAKPAAKSKSAASRGGGVFAAMMMDSDSE